MPAPTYSWAYVPDAHLDTASSVAATDWRDINRDLITCQEMTYDPAAHVAALAHDHDGRNSARVDPPSPNLIVTCKWNEETSSADFASENITFDGASDDTAGGNFESSGDYCGVLVGKSGLASAFGASALIAVSIYVRAVKPVTTGALRFGLSDASTSTFLAGCRAEIPAASLTGSWQRFWTVCTTPGVISTDLWMLALCSSSFDNELRADCPAATIGRNLSWWNVCPVESASTDIQDIYLRDISRKIPVFDGRVAMSQAVRLTAA